MSNPIWETSSNSDISINFSVELAKDVPSKGSWADDFKALADGFKILKCPYLSCSSLGADFQSLRLFNCVIDDANWKVALLACATSGSTIKEIAIQRCALEPSHMSDLVNLSEKTGSLVSLKLEYLTINNAKTNEYVENMKGLFTSIINPLEYISLRGSKLGDTFLSNLFSSVLHSSIYLKALNLSDNCLSEDGLTRILTSFRLNTCIEMLNASNNQITGIAIEPLTQVLFGSAVMADDDTIMKALAGKIADRNKSLKDINKKRKGNKPPLPEIPDVVSKPNQIPKVNAGPAGQVSKVVQASFSLLDLSGNPLGGASVESAFSKLRESISSTDPAILQIYRGADASQKRFTLLLHNVAFESHFDQSIHESFEVNNS